MSEGRPSRREIVLNGIVHALVVTHTPISINHRDNDDGTTTWTYSFDLETQQEPVTDIELEKIMESLVGEPR